MKLINYISLWHPITPIHMAPVVPHNMMIILWYGPYHVAEMNQILQFRIWMIEIKLYDVWIVKFYLSQLMGHIFGHNKGHRSFVRNFLIELETCKFQKIPKSGHICSLLSILYIHIVINNINNNILWEMLRKKVKR